MIPYLFIVCAFLMLVNFGFFVIFTEDREWKWAVASACVEVILVFIVSLLESYAR